MTTPPTPPARPPHLVVLAQYYWPEIIGSAPYCTDLAEWFAARGYRVTVIAARPAYPSPGQFRAWHDGSRDLEQRNGVTIRRIPASSRAGGGMLARLAGDVRFARGAARLARREGPADAVACFVPSVLSAYGARRVAGPGVPVVPVVHDIESGLAAATGIARLAPLVSAMRGLERRALSGARAVVVLSDAMRRELAEIGVAAPIHVVPIWVQPPPPAPAAGPGTTVMYSGNLGRKQNLDQLLPLIERFARRRPDVRFVFQGEGSERERLVAHVSERGFANVEFRPLVPADALIGSLQQADVHLVPQASNVADYAIPSKIFSIMSAGRPFVAIASDASPLHEIARASGGGLCLPPGDDDALAAAVERLLADPVLARETGENGRRHVERHLLRDTVMHDYERLLFGGAGRRPSAARASAERAGHDEMR